MRSCTSPSWRVASAFLLFHLELRLYWLCRPATAWWGKGPLCLPPGLLGWPPFLPVVMASIPRTFPSCTGIQVFGLPGIAVNGFKEVSSKVLYTEFTSTLYHLKAEDLLPDPLADSLVQPGLPLPDWSGHRRCLFPPPQHPSYPDPPPTPSPFPLSHWLCCPGEVADVLKFFILSRMSPWPGPSCPSSLPYLLAFWSRTASSYSLLVLLECWISHRCHCCHLVELA
jgi:hypothetical protein